MCEGLPALRMRAGIGPLSGMGPLVCFQIAESGKGLSAADPLAGKGPLSGMGPLVCFQVVALGTGLAAALVGAGKGPGSGMKEPCAIGPVGRLCRDPERLMAGDNSLCLAGEPAPGRRRFAGLCSMDVRCWCDKARDRGIVHAQRRSG